MLKTNARKVTRDPAKKSRTILKAARKEFARAGYDGARVDRIATFSKLSKGLIYHHFQSKDGLFQAVLEQLYAELGEANKDLYLENFEPEAGVQRLIEHTFDFFAKTPEFITLVNAENLLKAQHLKKSQRVGKTFEPLRESFEDLLARGNEQHVFRSNVDATELYISIVGLGYFFLSNKFTLGVVFDTNLTTADATEARRLHITEVVLGYLRNTSGG